MDGLSLCREMRRLDPGTIAFLITGYPADVTPAEVRAAGVRRVVPKPVDVGRLLARIDESLADRLGP